MEDNMAEYRGLEENRTSTQIAFALLYIGITLVVLLSAIWTGIAVADRLVRPIRYLIHAADAVAGGDLSVSLPVKTSDGDLGAFSNTFNNMIGQLSSQRSALLEANQVIDTRRRFIEAVLSGVTAGIIGVGPDGQITIINRSASALVAGRGGRISGPPLGQALETAIPELADIYRDVVRQKKRSHNASIMITRGGRERTYNVQITMEQSPEAQHSHVITVDDITDLVDAQRSSVWADVARRIAHEIKNPLTPIQLSAERLRRRYGKIVEHDREVFDRCTETIIRQVGDIGRMVDEFSTFARMPKPSPERHDMRAIAREALFLVEVSHAETGFTLEAGEDALFGMYDSRLMGQAIGNLVKNAAEAIEGAVADDAERPKGEIRLRTYRAGDRVVVDVIDNGRGFPAADRNRLLEPYMTTREKGTGLGLAIVRKIVEDHGGTITLMDAPGETGFASGAMVRLSLPMLPVDGAAHDGPAKEPELQNLGV
jgi:two-component system nitrogen regulation sensor histidine kinase NtrY